MASKKTESKKLLFSFSNGYLIDKVIEAKATLENKSKSAVLEEIITRELLPEDKEARYVIENLLFCENGGICKALEVLFANNAAGTGAWASKHDNFGELVRFAKTESCLYNQTILSGNESELPHLKSQYKNVIDKLTDENQKEYANAIYEELDKEPQFTRLGNIYQILQNDWENLKGWSITYRLLADMVRVEKDNWRDTVEAKAELMEIIKNTASEWHN
jgi:hypothetical protein